MRQVGVGKFTLGAVIVVLGVAFMFQMYGDYPAVRLVLDYWPLSVVMLGVEFLIVSRNPEVRARLSVWAVVFIGVAFLLAMAVRTGGVFFGYAGWPRVILPGSGEVYTVEIPVSSDIEADQKVVDLSMVGQVKVVGGSERTVKGTVSVEVVGSSYEDAKRVAERFEIEVHGSGDTLMIELTRPSGIVSFSNSKIASTFTLPADMALKLRTSAGSVTISGMTGEVEALTSAGSLTVDASPKAVDAKVSAGSLKASLGPEMTSFKARVSAGSMDLFVPGGVGATVKATASAGSISSSLPGLSITKSPGSGKASGTIGSGKCEVDVSVSAGSIRIDGPSEL